MPPRVLTNDDLSKMVDTSDAWIVERTGIRERRILEPSLAASDLADRGGRAGLPQGRASIRRPSTASSSAPSRRDMPVPGDRDLRAAEAGRARRAAARSISRRPAPGFIYGLSIADAFIRRGQFKRVLVIGVEVLSRIIDWTDRNTCVLFGDGAGAVLLAPDDEPARGILSTHLYADGSLADDPLQPGRRQPRADHAARRWPPSATS